MSDEQQVCVLPNQTLFPQIILFAQTHTYDKEKEREREGKREKIIHTDLHLFTCDYMHTNAAQRKQSHLQDHTSVLRTSRMTSVGSSRTIKFLPKSWPNIFNKFDRNSFPWYVFELIFGQLPPTLLSFNFLSLFI